MPCPQRRRPVQQGSGWARGGPGGLLPPRAQGCLGLSSLRGVEEGVVSATLSMAPPTGLRPAAPSHPMDRRCHLNVQPRMDPAHLAH